MILNKIRTLFFLLLCVPLLNSCDVLSQVVTVNTGAGSQPLTDLDIGNGLKEALNVGIKNGVQELMKPNGYFGNAALKILLPPEAQKVESIVTQYIPGGQDLINKAVLKMNEAAEDAAQEAVPIFANAITSMTFTDVRNILFGSQNAATTYLKDKTLTALTEAFAPKINNSLSKVGATQAWEALANPYNKFANSVAGQLLRDVKPINPDLGAYVTQKALDGLFYKVTEEEGKIRTNITNRTSDLLRRVFGELDKK